MADISKVYSRINWVNNQEPAINEDNLNRMDYAIDVLDDRIVEQNTTKMDKLDSYELIKSWVIDEETGIITVTKVNGSQIIFDLNIEKIPVDFSLSEDGILKMTTDDGTQFTANIGAMIPVLSFSDSDEIAVSVSGDGINKTYSFSGISVIIASRSYVRIAAVGIPAAYSIISVLYSIGTVLLYTVSPVLYSVILPPLYDSTYPP